MQSRVRFTGVFGYSKKEDTKMPLIKIGTTGSGNDYITVNAYVEEKRNNRANIELFGMKTDKIRIFDNERNQIEIPWSKRLDDDVINSATNKYVIVDGDGNRHEFISPWDFNNWIKDNIELLDGKKVTVTGRVNKNIYQGTISDRFEIRNIYIVNDDTKPGLTITEEIYFNKDSIDVSDWDSEKKLYVNGYVETYIDKNNGNKLVNRQLIFDCSKVDWDNEKHIKLVNYKLSQMGLTLNGNKITNNLKSNKTYKLIFIENYVNGNEEIAFDESTLTANQKLAIELGLKTLDDFRPSGNIFGNRVVLYKIKDFDLRSPYEDGCIDAELTESELEDMIYYIGEVSSESAEEVLDNSVTNKVEDDDDLSDLFD